MTNQTVTEVAHFKIGRTVPKKMGSVRKNKVYLRLFYFDEYETFHDYGKQMDVKCAIFSDADGFVTVFVVLEQFARSQIKFPEIQVSSRIKMKFFITRYCSAKSPLASEIENSYCCNFIGCPDITPKDITPKDITPKDITPKADIAPKCKLRTRKLR